MTTRTWLLASFLASSFALCLTAGCSGGTHQLGRVLDGGGGQLAVDANAFVSSAPGGTVASGGLSDSGGTIGSKSSTTAGGATSVGGSALGGATASAGSTSPRTGGATAPGGSTVGSSGTIRDGGPVDAPTLGGGAGATGTSTGGVGGRGSGTGTGGAGTGGAGTGGGTRAGGAGGTSTSGTGVGGNTACAQAAALDSSCSVDSDCLAVKHTTNCCGTTVWLGINKAGAQQFSSLESVCDASYPACGCASGPPTTSDGSVISYAASAGVTCQGGVCKTYASACGHLCETGRSCITCGQGDAGVSVCSLKCSGGTGCTEAAYPKCQASYGSSVCVAPDLPCM